MKKNPALREGDTTERSEAGLPHWLALAREIQALAQTGLAFGSTGYDAQRYRRLMEIAAEITASHTSLRVENVTPGFMS